MKENNIIIWQANILWTDFKMAVQKSSPSIHLTLTTSTLYISGEGNI